MPGSKPKAGRSDGPRGGDRSGPASDRWTPQDGSNQIWPSGGKSADVAVAAQKQGWFGGLGSLRSYLVERLLIVSSDGIPEMTIKGSFGTKQQIEGLFAGLATEPLPIPMHVFSHFVQNGLYQVDPGVLAILGKVVSSEFKKRSRESATDDDSRWLDGDGPGDWTNTEDTRVLRSILADRQAMERLCKTAVGKFVEEQERKTVEAVTSVLLWLETLGFNPELEPWVDRFGRKSFIDFVSGRYEERMKFLTAYLQAKHADDWGDRPDRPAFVPADDNHFLGGSAYTWFESRISRAVCLEGPDRRLEFVQALSGLKKRQPAIPGYKLGKAQKDWVRKIFYSDAPAAPHHPHLKAQFRAVVSEIVDKLDFPLKVPLPQPSVNARYGRSRNDGGAFSYIRQRILGSLSGDANSASLRVDDTGYFSHLMNGPNPVIWADYPEEVMTSTSFVVPAVEANARGSYAATPRVSTMDFFRDCVSPSGVITRERVASLEGFGSLAALSVLGDEVPELAVQYSALPEPFKVRSISKAAASSSFLRSVIQRSLHEGLQSLPEFHLTRERSDRRIAKIVSNSFGTESLRPDEGYVSGDYTASTDNLVSWASEMVVDAIARKLHMDPFMHDLFERSLTGHVYMEPDLNLEHESRKSGGQLLHFIRQTMGQLMGSETSFPILCIVNLAASITAMRIHESMEIEGIIPGVTGVPGVKPWWKKSKAARSRLSYQPGQTGFVVNGDDFAAKMTRSQYATWRAVMPDFGLAPSMGKNFFSREFVQINSRMLVPRITEATAWRENYLLEQKVLLDPMLLLVVPREVEYVLVPSHSLAVLAPPRRVPYSEACLSLPQWQETFLDESTGSRRDQLNSLFIRVWSPYLRRLPTEYMNWFVPRSLGGFGLTATRPIQVTTVQRHIAAYFRDHTTPESYRDAKLTWMQPDVSTTVHKDELSVLRVLERSGLVEWRWLADHEKELTTGAVRAPLVWSGFSKSTAKDAFIVEDRAVTEALIRDEVLFKCSVDPAYGDEDGSVSLGPDRNEVHDWTDVEAEIDICLSPQVQFARLKVRESHVGPDEDDDATVKATNVPGAELHPEEHPQRPKKPWESVPEDLTWLSRTLTRLKKASKSTGRAMDLADIQVYRGRKAGWIPCAGLSVVTSEMKVNLGTGAPLAPRLAGPPLLEFPMVQPNLHGRLGETVWGDRECFSFQPRVADDDEDDSRGLPFLLTLREREPPPQSAQ